jgi:deoxycytidylate deaminase
MGPKEYQPKGRTLQDFHSDDERDRDQEFMYGQQIQLCVDQADVLVTNDAEVTLASLRRKLAEYAELVTGENPRYAEPKEILMNLAYSSSHGTKCLKRQVGAILVTAPPGEMGEIVGQGFNENPIGTRPCVEEPQYGADEDQGKLGRCFRDIVRHESYVKFARSKRRCPACGKVLTAKISKVPPWRCAKCNAQLEEFFWPERAMSLCTAVHAEVAAIMAARGRARGATLYSTTFPCFQCAEKLTHAGVKFVVYTEPYPDIRAATRLEIAGIDVAKFEGIRSGRFDEIFSRARPHISEQVRILAEKDV